MYFGLYGGSDHPGVLAGDPAADHLRAAGWLETGRVHLVRRELADFRPVVDMVQRKLRMTWNVIPRPEPPPRDEAEAFALVHSDHTRFDLVEKRNGTVGGSCLVWDLEPLASLEAERMAGLIRVETDAARRKAGLATLLVGDALAYAKTLQITAAHAQFDAADQPSERLFKKLGFARIGEGVILRKELH
jgi:RimJ/RimL family protein N-acetyltransferase